MVWIAEVYSTHIIMKSRPPGKMIHAANKVALNFEDQYIPTLCAQSAAPYIKSINLTLRGGQPLCHSR